MRSNFNRDVFRTFMVHLFSSSRKSVAERKCFFLLKGRVQEK